MGLPAGQPVPRREVRRRIRHVVRQRPGRRPHRRRVQACELGRLVRARRRARARRRRPRREVLDARASVGTHLQGLRAAGAVSVQRAGISRLRPARLGDEPLLGAVGRAQVRDGRRRIVGIGRHRPASHRHRAADRLRAAGRRPEHPLAGPAARAGSAAARLQVVRGARVRAREQARPDRDRLAECPLRDHDGRQGLPRRASGADRPRPRRRHLRADRHPPVQGRLRVAARSAGRAGVRARPRRNPGRRGKAPDPRIRDQGRAVQLARRAAPARVRQVRRKGRRRRRMVGADGQLAAARALRAVARDHREGDRDAPRQVRAAVRRARAHRRAARGDQREGNGAREAARADRAQAVVLFGLPAQHVDQRAGRLARDRRDRLPLHDGLDGPQHEHLQPDGRRRRAVDRPGAVYRREARVREPRRRHLLPLGPAGGARGDLVEGEHHLQDPLQRRGRDDGRPAGRRRADGAADHAPARVRRREADRDRHRRAGKVRQPEGAARARRDDPSPRPARRRAARAARDRRHDDPDLRPDLCDREAPSPQARHLSRPGEARRDQRCGMRRLRRLLGEVELPVGRAARNGIRHEAPDQSVELQQGLLLREGVLPELRHGRRRPVEEAEGGGRRRRRAAADPGAGAAGDRPRLRRARDRRGRHRRRHDRRAARDGRAPREQGRDRARRHRPRAERRRGDEPRADLACADRHPRDAHCNGRGRPRDRLRRDRHGRRRMHVADAARCDARRREQCADADRRVHQEPELGVPGLVGRERHSRGGRRSRRLHRRQPFRGRAARRCDLHEPVRARLRVAEGLAAAHARVARTGDRAERGVGREEPRRIRLGPPRGARPGEREAGGRRRRGRRATRHRDRAAHEEGGRCADREARGVPHRLPERRICGALRGLRRQGARGRTHARRRRRGAGAADRSGRAQPVQADGVQGRIRGRAPAVRSGVRRASVVAVRRRLEAEIPSRAAAVREEGRARPSREEGVRPVDAVGLPPAREGEVPARHRPRPVRTHRGAPHRARADRRVRGADRRSAGPAERGQPPARARAGRAAGRHPRVRPREGEQPARGAPEVGCAAGEVALAGGRAVAPAGRVTQVAGGRAGRRPPLQ
ncbi:hypothetical protein BVI434_1910012 [Burkholderia vietnamiensis]|nr:hypothetical protein BVI434_1910012 [Burkholderia vietnamiensis]